MLSDIHSYRLCAYDRNNNEHEAYLEEVILLLKTVLLYSTINPFFFF